MVPWPPAFQHLKLRPKKVARPGQYTLKSGVITPSSSAAVATAILNVDPGEYRPWIARSCSGRSVSVLSAAHVARSIPAANAFGSYAGRLVKASSSPLVGFMMTAAPR